MNYYRFQSLPSDIYCLAFCKVKSIHITNTNSDKFAISLKYLKFIFFEYGIIALYFKNILHFSIVYKNFVSEDKNYDF